METESDLLTTLAAELATALEINYPDRNALVGAWSEALEAMAKVKVLLEEAGKPVPDALTNVLAIATSNPVEVTFQKQPGHNEPG